MRFIKSAFTTLIFKTVAMIAGLAISIVIARVLGPEGRGLYALIMTIIVLSASFGVFGLTASNTYFVAKDQRKARTIGIQSIVIGILGAALSIGTVYFVEFVSPTVLRGLDSELMLLTFALIPFFLWGNLFSFAYLGRGKIFAFNTFETAQRVIFFVLAVLILWYLRESLSWYLTVVLCCIAIMVAWFMTNYFRDTAAGPVYESGFTVESFAYGVKSYIATMLTLAVMRSGVLFVNYYGGNDDAGLFAVSQQISELVIIIPTVVGTVLFGRISRGDSYELTPKVLRTMTAVFLPVTLVMILGGEWLIVKVFGVEFTGSIEALRIMLPGAFLLGLEVIIAKDIAGRGYPWPAVFAWIPVLLINVVGFVFLIPKFGVNGAAISVSVSFLTIFLLMISYYLKLSKFTISELFVLKAEDVRVLRSQLVSLFSERISFSHKEEELADSTVSHQDTTEIQSVGR